ncbi:MAG: hypothetical protein K2Y30_01145 [Flavobacteriaceae bacterium]|nr:hypothetical protein [Flavobacteriaceae bacterium]
MDERKKNILLQNCNNLDTNQLIDVVKTGHISIDEFRNAGLDLGKINQIVNSFINKEQEQRTKEQAQAIADRKNEWLERVIKGKASADEIKANINNRAYTFEDLEEAGINSRTINSLKHYCNSNRITMFKNISQLPVMEEGRTDVYFVGVPGSGKSTMLSGLLNMANKDGILIPDTYNNDGSVYQTQLISDLNRGVLPNATASGSYNYVPLSIKDENGSKHPFNIVEVPGENYVNMFNNGDVGDFLNYISNNNKKILIFVIDSLAHDTGYNDSNSQLDQNLVYVNILNMFKSNGILEQTDAIYLVANKFDAIKESRFAANNSADDELALDFLQDEFKNLINNCKDARDDSKSKFKIKILPFSIGNVSYTSIIDNFNKEYSSVVINNLIEDSFVVKGSRFKIFS